MVARSYGLEAVDAALPSSNPSSQGSQAASACTAAGSARSRAIGGPANGRARSAASAIAGPRILAFTASAGFGFVGQSVSLQSTPVAARRQPSKLKSTKPLAEIASAWAVNSVSEK